MCRFLVYWLGRLTEQDTDYESTGMSLYPYGALFQFMSQFLHEVPLKLAEMSV